jgi:hypothetical protein
VPTAATHWSPLITHTGITGPLLLVHLLAAARNLCSSFGFGCTDAQIGLIHHNRVMQQNLVDAISDLSQIKRVRLAGGDARL